MRSGFKGRDWKGVVGEAVAEAVEGAGVFCRHSQDNSLAVRVSHYLNVPGQVVELV